MVRLGMRLIAAVLIAASSGCSPEAEPVDAFRAARVAAPEMKLYYNDHSAEIKSGRRISRRCPTCARTSNASPTSASSCVSPRWTSAPPWRTESSRRRTPARQQEVYATMATLCGQQPACTGITLWGFTDKRSWITDHSATFSGYGAANVYDVDYRRKPA